MKLSTLYRLAAENGMQVMVDNKLKYLTVDSPPFMAFECEPDGTPALTCLLADWEDPTVTKGEAVADAVERIKDYLSCGLEAITKYCNGYPDPENWPKPTAPEGGEA